MAAEAEGLVVDVRYNRGGHTSQLVLEQLARRVVGWSVARHAAVAEPYPENALRGPVVFVANEFSGSDGDIVNAGAQAMGLGPVVGVRTWGGVIGIDGRFELVDGTKITQPRYATWLQRLRLGGGEPRRRPRHRGRAHPGRLRLPRRPPAGPGHRGEPRPAGHHPGDQPPPLPEPRVR